MHVGSRSIYVISDQQINEGQWDQPTISMVHTWMGEQVDMLEDHLVGYVGVHSDLWDNSRLS